MTDLKYDINKDFKNTLMSKVGDGSHDSFKDYKDDMLDFTSNNIFNRQ